MRALTIAALCLALAGPCWAAKQSTYPDKVAPVTGDKVLITDSEASNAPKQVTLGAIADLAGTSMPYPGAGVPLSTGSAWGTSYTVGTAANNLVQLNASAQLPAVSADLLTITDTGTYFTTDTVAAALQELGSGLADVTEITLDASLTETGGVLSVTNPVTTEVYGADWSADTEGTMRKDIYAILHAGDTDDDGKADLLDAAVVIPDSGTLTFDESAADPNDADVQLSATDGVFKLAAVNGANNEDLTIDLDGAANTVTLSSSTGLTMITTGSIPFTSAVKTTAIDTDTTLSGALEYGVMTFNTAASTRTLTVTAGAGKSGCFRNAQGVAQILRIDAADGDYIVKPTGARTSASGEYYGATADAKNQICWVSYDNDDIYITSEVGTWTEQE